MRKVMVIAGVTAVGKSSAAVRFAVRQGGEVICADSTQAYQHLTIGSAKPTVEQLERVPHHLVGFASPLGEPYTAGKFYRDARRAADSALNRGKVPVVVGGAWMYLRFFLYGLPATPPPTRQVREMVEQLVESCRPDWDCAISVLRLVDPSAAAKLHRNTWKQLKRYLEVFFTCGVPISELPRLGAAPGAAPQEAAEYDARCVFLTAPPSVVLDRIDRRCAAMLDRGGIVEEVANLLGRGFLPHGAPCAKGVGYRQIAGHLRHRLSELEHGVPVSIEQVEKTVAVEKTVEAFFKSHRQLAREQRRWFRRENNYCWVDATDEASVDARLEHLWTCPREEFREEVAACSRILEQSAGGAAISVAPTGAAPGREVLDRLVDFRDVAERLEAAAWVLHRSRSADPSLVAPGDP